MFKISNSSSSIDPVYNVLSNLDKSTANLLERAESWHNVFYEEIIKPFPEAPFAVLYPSKTGRPNSPVRFLVGMLVLKEGHDWTDEQLFEEIQFNIKVRWALGFRNLNDSIPASSTYYAFKYAVHEYHRTTGIDLLENAFEQVTINQIKKYKINGRNFRMDSKLYSCNIATSSLARLLTETLQLFLRELSEIEYKLIDSSFSDLLQQITKGSSDGITYQMTKEDKANFIKNCGKLLLHLRDTFAGQATKSYALIVRLLTEQFDIIPKELPEQDEQEEKSSINSSAKVQLKDRKEVNGSTLQSPHDPEAAYRKKKNGTHVQEVRGYVTNIGETCSKEDPFNLITTPTTKPVTAVDNHFVEKSIHQAQYVGGKIDFSWQDGAYSSLVNRQFLELEKITAYFPALSGKESFHHFEWKDDPDKPNEKKLIVTDLRDGKIYPAKTVIDRKGNKRYRITYQQPHKDGRNSYRYFTPQEIINFFKRRSIEQIPKEILDRRAGIEATIWQVFCKLGKKTRYRGLIANHHMVLGRCFWTNNQRITKYLTRKARKQLGLMFLTLSYFMNAHKTTFALKL